jgi:CelD/BcsL family acetyltransferase involved in cellulose biosynthesis
VKAEAVARLGTRRRRKGTFLTFPATAISAEKLLTAASSDGGGASPWGPTARPEPGRLPFDAVGEDGGLAREWNRLEAAASLPTQSKSFASALSNTLLGSAAIEVYFIRAGDGVVALLPLCRETRPFARWRMVGEFEPGDALCRNREAARYLAEAIVADSRPLQLDRLAATSPLIPAVRAAMKGKGWVSVRPGVPTPTIALDESWKDAASKFNSGRRSDFRRAARRAAEFGNPTFEMVSPAPAQFDALFDEAAEVERRSWKGEAGSAFCLDRAKLGFYRDFFRSACDRGEFRLGFLRIDGQAVAMQMAIESLGRYWLFKIGFDEKFGRCSPGALLMLHSLEWAAGRKLRGYELLGKAEDWIAQFWTRDHQECVRLRTYPFNVRGAVALAADAIVWLRARLMRRSG